MGDRRSGEGQAAAGDLVGYYRQMAGGVGLAIVAAVFVAWSGTRLLAGRGAVRDSLAGVASHRAMDQSAARSTNPAPLSTADTQALRLIARRTWRFFETFVTAEDHMLPPDNFQEDPLPVLAHRTSPTNLGLYLLSVVAARDFGWIGMPETVERLEATLGSMDRLERFRGHFYNWYGTLDLRPLEPKYISSVDSGNLAGHLVALWNACEEMVRHPVIGIRDGSTGLAMVWNLCAARSGAGGDPGSANRKQLDDALEHLAALLGTAPSTPAGMSRQLTELACLPGRRPRAKSRNRNMRSADNEALIWAGALGDCHSRSRTLPRR